MAEGDTIVRAARRIGEALAGSRLEAEPRGRARGLGLERLDGGVLEMVEPRGKHLLLRFGGLILHSHLGMGGSWQVSRRGAPWRKPAAAAWLVLREDAFEAVEFGGPTLRLLTPAQLRGDPLLSRLGPDILAPQPQPAVLMRSIHRADHLELGEALLDQRLVAGIGNIFKSEACFAAAVDPWRRVGDLSDEELGTVIEAAGGLMRDSVNGGRPRLAVYRRAGRPCPRCGAPISARGQGDANRRTYWCPGCQC